MRSSSIWIMIFSLILATTAEWNTSSKDCPLWTTLQNDSCKCGSSVSDTVKCEDYEGAFAVSSCYCMTASRDGISPVIGSCLYASQSFGDSSYYDLTTNKTEELDSLICEPYNRTGVLCGECIEGYGLPVYSYTLSCVECSDYKYNWLKYIAIVYIPLTLFYIVIVWFRVSATSGLLAGYITLCQMVRVKRVVIWSNFFHHQHVVKLFASFGSIWNLDFFRSLYSPFCLHPKLSALHVFMLDYAVALYPLLLIFLTYVAVKLHDRYSLVVWLCRPLTTCCFYFRKEWNVKNSILETFATFYILSYVKVMNTNTEIIRFVSLTDMHSHHRFAYFNNPILPFFGKDHYPFALVAIAFLVLFNVLPFFLLCLYPCHCFHKCLNKTGCRCQALHIFMDAILGAYSHRPRERRYFGAIYIGLRVLHQFASAMCLTSYLSAASYIMIGAIVLVSVFQPYKKSWHNVLDVVLFFAVLNCYLMLIFMRDAKLTDPPTASLQIPIYRFSMIVSLTVLFLYGVVAVLAVILPQNCIDRLIRKVVRKNKNIELVESLPYRIDHSERDPLI